MVGNFRHRLARSICYVENRFYRSNEVKTRYVDLVFRNLEKLTGPCGLSAVGPSPSLQRTTFLSESAASQESATSLCLDRHN